MAVLMHKLTADGHDGLCQCLAEMRRSNRLYNGGIFVHFTGSKVEDTGLSWCPDCAKADPLIDQAIDQLSKMTTTTTDPQQPQRHIAFIKCDVGQRENWKSPTNSIKADGTLDVQCVPTIIEYSLANGQRVEGRKLDKDEHFKSVEGIMDFVMNKKST